MSKLYRSVILRSELSASDTDEMFALMCSYYENVLWDSFLHDLNKKNYIIMLRTLEGNQLAGFSTQEFFTTIFNGQHIGVLYSGDTIINHDYWGSLELPLAFGELMQTLIAQYGHMPLYWMLISKGARTYRFLPVFFQHFYPAQKVDTPAEVQELMHFLGNFKFADQYDATRGIVKASPKGQFLRQEFQPDQKREHPHIQFFCSKNPGYALGDELLCVTYLRNDNLSGFVKRVLHI